MQLRGGTLHSRMRMRYGVSYITCKGPRHGDCSIQPENMHYVHHTVHIYQPPWTPTGFL